MEIFTAILKNITKDTKIPTKTIVTLNPSSQVCYEENSKQIGTCLRQVWLDKTDQKRTNPLGLNAIMSGFSGNWWENWLIDQTKELGIYHSSSFTLTDPSRIVKGIVDLATIDIELNEIILNEIKTYDGSNYNNSSLIIGNTKVDPKPRDKHLLQLFRYLLIAQQNKITKGNLLYIDRACGLYSRNKQFHVELIKVNNVTYPKITTHNTKGEIVEYVDVRITDNGIYEAEEKLLDCLSTNTIPTKEFKEVYSEIETELNYSKGLVSKYVYEKWKRDPVNNSVGDHQCKYCPFAGGTCSNWI